MNLSAAVASPAAELSEQAQDGFFEQVYYDYLHEPIASNDQLMAALTMIGVVLVGFQCCWFLYQVSKRGAKGALVWSPMLGGILISVMLIHPTVMMPLMLSIIDWIIGVILSIFTQASG